MSMMDNIILKMAEAREEIRNLRPIADASCILSPHSILTMPDGRTKALCHCINQHGSMSEREYILENHSFVNYFKPQYDFTSPNEIEEYLKGGGTVITPYNYKVWYQIKVIDGLEYHIQRSNKTKSRHLTLNNYWSYRKYDSTIEDFQDFLSNLDEFKNASR